MQSNQVIEDDQQLTTEPESSDNPSLQAPETPAATPITAEDMQREIQSALDAQQAALNQQIREATGHASFQDYMDDQSRLHGEAQAALDAKAKETDKFRLLYEQTAIKAAVLSAASEAINPDMVLTLLVGQAAVSEDGSVLIGGKPAKEAVDELLQKNPFMAKPSGNSGSGASVGACGLINHAANPWAEASFNLTEQARLIRSNPTEAARLKAAAGR